MADVHTPEVRKYNMSRITSKDTKGEVIIQEFLRKNNIEFSKHYKDLPGSPDIFIKDKKLIIDIRGCYFHRHHDCQYAYIPKTNTEKYLKKFKANIERDNRNIDLWAALNLKVLVIWSDCQLQPKRKCSEIREKTLTDLLNFYKVEDTSN